MPLGEDQADFLRDVKCLMVTIYDTHAQRYSADNRSSYDVQPLVDWALGAELVEHGENDTRHMPRNGIVLRLTVKGRDIYETDRARKLREAGL